MTGGRPIKRSWHLLAEGNDGPLIPSMAVEALVRRALDGQLAGARCACRVRELELDDYEGLFASKAIYSGIREDAFSGVMPLYARLLGASWKNCPSQSGLCTMSVSRHQQKDGQAWFVVPACWRGTSPNCRRSGA